MEPRRCKLVLQGQRIGEIAVVGDGEAATGEFGEQRLDVALDGAAVGRIAVVADGAVAGEIFHDARLGEGVADQADMTLGAKRLAVIGDDAGRLLATMLESMQAEDGERRRVGMAEHAENAALLVQLVGIERQRRQIVHQPRFRRVSWRHCSGSAG